MSQYYDFLGYDTVVLLDGIKVPEENTASIIRAGDSYYNLLGCTM
jgi:hypothetical protein